MANETLLTASAVKLYGRVIEGLGVDLSGAAAGLGANRFLREQLEPGTEPHFARIYGFCYMGRYTPLSRAAIFLVHGPGEKAVDPTAAKGGGAAGPHTIEESGQAFKCGEFASDVRLWEYDRGDFSLRLDIDSGPLERILLDSEEGGDAPPYFRQSKTRMRGPGE